MSKRYTISLILFLFATSFPAIAQLSDKEKFTEALYLMDEKRFSVALPLFMELYEQEKYKDNANINYNIGVAILNSFNEKEKEQALPYLSVAAKSVNPNYTPFSPREKDAPVDAHYYLGKAQHNDYQFNNAIESFKEFKKYINDKHYLWKAIDRDIRMAEYAKKAILNPVNIKVNNLGGKINSYYADFSPVVRIDETAIYFTSRRLREDSSNYEIYDPIDGMLFEDLYVSFNENGEWGKPHPLNINTSGHEATINLSIDGQTLYIYKDIDGNGELFKSEIERDSAGFEIWSEPKKLGSDINSDAYETHVTITPDEKTLYFISDREGGFGGKDIYMCRKLPTGNWALAQNAGPVLNSEHDEDGVFMHPDGKTMYFSSNGHESMGGYDIVYSTLSDSGWSEPSNMGYPINSVDDDVFFVTTPDGKRAYFSSFKEEGYGEKDIYMLELIDAEEKALTLYRGEFTFVDRMTPPSGASVSITDNTTGELVGVYTPRLRDGQFSAILEPNKSYHFVYEADAYRTYEEDIYVPASANYQEIYKEIQLKPVRVGDGMDKITPAPIAMASLKGKISAKGVPTDSIKILLLNEQEDLLQKTETDDVGVFNFTELDPSKTYLIRVITSGENPIQDYEIDLQNDRGEILTFEKIDDSTYIFVPSLSPYEYYGIKAKAIAGQVKKAGQPVAGLNVRLEDEQRELIQEEETDAVGEFNFKKLDLDKEYRIVFEGDFPEDPEIVITNDIGQVMEFKKVDDGIYQYVPKEADKPRQLAGVVKSAGQPVSGLNVRLEDEMSSVLQEETTDQVGEFNFQRLNLDKKYRIVFDGDFPDDTEIVLTNEYGQELAFKKVSKGVYEYVPEGYTEGAPLAVVSDIEGAVTSEDYPVVDLKVLLLNNEQELLNSASTDSLGKFNFLDLNLNRTYYIQFEGDYPDDIKLVVANEDLDLLLFRKIQDGLYKYDPLFKVKLVNQDRQLMQEETTDKVDEFNYQKLEADKTYQIIFEGDYPDDNEIIITNDKGQDFMFKQISKGVYEYRPAAPFPLRSYTLNVKDEEDFKKTYPRPEELDGVIAYFQRYFIYNAKDINEQNKEFVSFINDIAKLVKVRGYADIIITSSASKVPTRTWKTNSILTKKRAYDTKRLLEKVFTNKGIKEDQYNFVDINTLITGPEYKGDYLENKSTYEKYQYVRIFIK